MSQRDGKNKDTVLRCDKTTRPQRDSYNIRLKVKTTGCHNLNSCLLFLQYQIQRNDNVITKTYTLRFDITKIRRQDNVTAAI